MLMHLSFGVAAKVSGLEECRGRAVYVDMQIAQSCKSYSRVDLAVAYTVQSCGSCGRVRHAVVHIAQSRGLYSRADHAVAQIMQSCGSRDRANQAAVQFVRIRPHLRLPAHSPARSLTCCRCR